MLYCFKRNFKKIKSVFSGQAEQDCKAVLCFKKLIKQILRENTKFFKTFCFSLM